MSLETLADIQFCDTDTQTVEQNIITVYESIKGTSLYPGDPVRLFLETLAAVIVQQRSIIDHAGKQNLLKYAREDHLDHLGAMTHTPRLEAASAMATIRFSSVEPLDFSVVVPSGTRVSPDLALFFETIMDHVLPSGTPYLDIPVRCLTPGDIGNGFLPGQVNKLVDPIPGIASVSNTVITSGGGDVEKDAPYRERIHTAPESFSVAGPIGAYQHWVKSAHQDISDVAVYRTSPLDDLAESQLDGVLELAGMDSQGLSIKEKQIQVASWLSASTVNVCPLLSGGHLPDKTMLDLVREKVNDRSVRPLTDQVVVAPPEPVEYDITLTYFISDENRLAVSDIQARVARAVDNYIAWQKGRLGRDINPDQLTHFLMEAGAKRAEISSPGYVALGKNAVAKDRHINITYGGVEGE